MTSQPDPLVALWRTAPQPDIQSLLRDLDRLNRLHRRLNRNITVILCGISLLLIFEEATGRVTTHGILSAVWISCLAIGVIWHRRARGSCADALTLDTVALLKSMIVRAKRDLFIARCLYAGVPCGAAAGYFLANLAGIGSHRSASGSLELIQTAAGVAVLLAMIVTGIILARSRGQQVCELSEKLKSLEE